MKIGDFHVHTTGSDGELSPEQTAKKAIALGLPYICFTDHYPFPPEFESGFKDASRWTHFHNQEYYEEVQRLKKEFAGKIDICFGAEFNWLEKYQDWTLQEIKKRPYDYALAAVHMVPKGKNPNPVNWNEEIFQQAIDDYNGIQNLVREYYKQVRLLAQSGLFDCIAHLDIIKALNDNNKFFSEKDDWYQQEVLQALDTIAESGICIEINTCGLRTFYPCKEQFPSFWILQEMNKRNIPITIGSDAHVKQHLGWGLDKAVELAKQAGYKHILRFKNRKPIEVGI